MTRDHMACKAEIASHLTFYRKSANFTFKAIKIVFKDVFIAFLDTFTFLREARIIHSLLI